MIFRPRQARRAMTSIYSFYALSKPLPYLNVVFDHQYEGMDTSINWGVWNIDASKTAADLAYLIPTANSCTFLWAKESPDMYYWPINNCTENSIKHRIDYFCH
jgi:hypothetical protein